MSYEFTIEKSVPHICFLLQTVLQEILGKFDVMEQRMAVIKKYAKHGSNIRSGSTPTNLTRSNDLEGQICYLLSFLPFSLCSISFILSFIFLKASKTNGHCIDFCLILTFREFLLMVVLISVNQNHLNTGH